MAEITKYHPYQSLNAITIVNPIIQSKLQSNMLISQIRTQIQ